MYPVFKENVHGSSFVATYLDQEDNVRAAISIGHAKLLTFGDPKFLPLPLGQGLGTLMKFAPRDKGQGNTHQLPQLDRSEEALDRSP